MNEERKVIISTGGREDGDVEVVSNAALDFARGYCFAACGSFDFVRRDCSRNVIIDIDEHEFFDAAAFEFALREFFKTPELMNFDVPDVFLEIRIITDPKKKK